MISRNGLLVVSFGTTSPESRLLNIDPVEQAIEDLRNGVTPEKYEYVDEDIFSSYEEITEVSVDDKVYPVSIMKQ